MKDVIEAGEYVRTKNGKIDKVVSNNYYMEKYIEAEKDFIFCKNILKHSKQLIDLIESGDIVNGHLFIDKYEDVDEYGNDFWCLIIEDDSLLNRSIREENIQTILTKEQFEANCYKGGEEYELF